MSERKPETTFRHRNIKAAVWQNEGGKLGVFYNVTFQRSYREEDSKAWKNTQSFGAFDLFDLVRCALDAYVFIGNKMREHAQQADEPAA